MPSNASPVVFSHRQNFEMKWVGRARVHVFRHDFNHLLLLGKQEGHTDEAPLVIFTGKAQRLQVAT